MKRNFIISFFLLSLLFSLSAEDSEIKTIDLDNLEGGTLRAGIELAMPISGLTAGYHLSEKMEVNVLVGSMMDFSAVTLGVSGLYTLANLEIQDQILPLNLGPVLYATFGSEVWFSAGARVQLEYDFDIPLNVYIMSGFIYNITRADGDPAFNFPFGIGARYIF